MKLFISHAEKDAAIVKRLVELLLCIGMKEEDMFCSSVAGLGIPIKQNIYDYLRELLKRDDIYVMFMLSDNYYQSPACLNEMGAAWVTRHDCITFLLPGFEYKDIAGAVDPRELSIKLDDDELLIKSRLGEFKDDLMRKFGFRVSEIRWEQCRDAFLKSIQPKETVFNLKESETFCIGDMYKEGCALRKRSKEEITVHIDFKKTSSDLCTLVIYPSEENWTTWIRKERNLEFEIYADSSIRKLQLELQIPSAGRNTQYDLENLNGAVSVPLSDVCPVAEKCSQVKQINFLLYRNDVDDEGDFTVKNVRVR